MHGPAVQLRSTADPTSTRGGYHLAFGNHLGLMLSYCSKVLLALKSLAQFLLFITEKGTGAK